MAHFTCVCGVPITMSDSSSSFGDSESEEELLLLGMLEDESDDDRIQQHTRRGGSLGQCNKDPSHQFLSYISNLVLGVQVYDVAACYISDLNS